jgi:hypothetical protein
MAPSIAIQETPDGYCLAELVEAQANIHDTYCGMPSEYCGMPSEYCVSGKEFV